MKFLTVVVLVVAIFTAGATEARWHWIVNGTRKLWAKWGPK